MTEVLYLLKFSQRAQSAAIDFVLSGAILLVPSSLESLKRTKRLIEKYKDIPMDYADATLVTIAEDFSITHVATFDAKDFSIYRRSLKQPFVILP